MRHAILFAAALSLAASAHAGEFSYEPGTYRFGGTYSIVAATDPDACAMTCGSDDACLAWSFQRQTGGLGPSRCELKRTLGRSEANPLMVSGVAPQLFEEGSVSWQWSDDEELVGASADPAPAPEAPALRASARSLELTPPLVTSENRVIRIMTVDEIIAYGQSGELRPAP